MRFLFHCRSTTGLGHLMRGWNIATAMRQLAPSTEIIFTGSRKSVAPILAGFGYERTLTSERVRRLCPDVIVLDTLLPHWELPPDIPIAYVMRKIRPETRNELLNDPALSRVGLILIPHTFDEYSDELPPHLREKAVWVGPIVRDLDPRVQEAFRTTYDLPEDAFVVTCTAGGGGRSESAFFFDLVAKLYHPLRAQFRNLRYLIVSGPYARTAVASQTGMTVLRFEPSINNLFALSNLVIAEGGYNTVNEIRAARSPAVFVPSARKHDDQEERVRALERRGLCAIVTEHTPDAVGDIVDLCRSRDRLDEMRAHYLRDHFVPGNLTAAARLLELAAAIRVRRMSLKVR